MAKKHQKSISKAKSKCQVQKSSSKNNLILTIRGEKKIQVTNNPYRNNELHFSLTIAQSICSTKNLAFLAIKTAFS